MENELIFVFKNIMKLTVGAALCVALSVSAQAQELKIGFVSTERIFRDAAPAKAATAKLEQEFSKREKDLQELGARLKATAEKLDKDAPVLPDGDRLKRQRELTEMDKDFQRRLLSTLDDVTFIQNDFLIAKVQEPENKMKVFGKENNYVQDVLIGTTIYLSSLDDPVQQIYQIT